MKLRTLYVPKPVIDTQVITPLGVDLNHNNNNNNNNNNPTDYKPLVETLDNPLPDLPIVGGVVPRRMSDGKDILPRGHRSTDYFTEIEQGIALIGYEEFRTQIGEFLNNRNYLLTSLLSSELESRREEYWLLIRSVLGDKELSEVETLFKNYRKHSLGMPLVIIYSANPLLDLNSLSSERVSVVPMKGKNVVSDIAEIVDSMWDRENRNFQTRATSHLDKWFNTQRVHFDPRKSGN